MSPENNNDALQMISMKYLSDGHTKMQYHQKSNPSSPYQNLQLL
jgi:hypothetical protein